MDQTETAHADPMITVQADGALDGGAGLPATVELVTRARALYDQVVSDPQAFAAEATSVVSRARALNQPTALIPALRAQAWVERSRFENREAKALLDEAARLARSHHLREELSDVLISRAAVNHELGRLHQAQRDLDAAGRLGLGKSFIDVTFQQAVLYQNLGQLAHARLMYRRILENADAPVAVQVKTANNYAIVESQLGHPDEAMRLIEYGKSFPNIGPHLTAVLSSTRAWIITQSGRLTQGLDEFAEADRLHTVAGLPLAEHYLEYVDALTDLRLLPEAHQMAKKAVRELEQHGVDLMTGEGYLRVARLAALLGNSEAAIEAAKLAREQFDRQRRLPWRARTDVIIGEVEHGSGHVSPGTLAAVRRAAATLERLRLHSHAVEAHLIAGRLGLLLGQRTRAVTNLQRAASLGRSAPILLRLKAHLAKCLSTPVPDRTRLRHCRAGLDDLAQHRAAFASLELRVRASGHGAELGELGLETLVRHGAPAEVLRWLERTRAAALLAVEPVGELGIADELGELRAIQAEITETQRDGSDSNALLVRQRAIEERIRKQTWSSAGNVAAEHQLPTASELRGQLGDRTLIEFAILANQVIAVVLERRRTRLVPLGDVSEVRRAADVLLFGLRRLTRPARSTATVASVKASVEQALRALHEQLLAPLDLPRDQPMVVSPTTGLRRIPWSALHSAPVWVVPAASFWERTARSQHRTTQHRTTRVLLVAGPHLPGAVEEVTQLSKLHSSPSVLVPPNSTSSAVLPLLAEADLAHIACHGSLRADNPAFSGLELQDGPLTLHEMDVRGVAPHRMVLASCDSAVEATYEGNEVLGFVSALMARGVCGLVASVVLVPDAASVPLMLGLHRGVCEGRSLAEALFDARASLDRGDEREFVNWCAFNAYGAA